MLCITSPHHKNRSSLGPPTCVLFTMLELSIEILSVSFSLGHQQIRCVLAFYSCLAQITFLRASGWLRHRYFAEIPYFQRKLQAVFTFIPEPLRHVTQLAECYKASAAATCDRQLQLSSNTLPRPTVYQSIFTSQNGELPSNMNVIRIESKGLIYGNCTGQFLRISSRFLSGPIGRLDAARLRFRPAYQHRLMLSWLVARCHPYDPSNALFSPAVESPTPNEVSILTAIHRRLVHYSPRRSSREP